MKLRDYQTEAINATLNYCKRKRGNPLIVLPTGSGKSLVISNLAEQIHKRIPDKKMLVLAHRKELIEQNAAKFNVPVSIFHAGIGIKETDKPIIVGGIQSVYNSIDEFKNIGAVIVDECDLISFDSDSRYRKTLEYFNVRTIGLTATPYRLDGGMLYIGDNAYFDEIVYEKKIKEMIGQGYLCKLISKVSEFQPDLKDVKIRMGDYVKEQLEEAMIDPVLIQNSVESLLKYTADRKKILIFSPSIKHAEILKEIIPDSEVVTGNLSMKERERILLDFHTGEIKYLINVDVLTVGFDEPAIDCVAMMRPTKSTRLYVQMCGRGFRIAEHKENCLILDYAGNIREHGAIDKVRVQYNPKTEKAEVEKFDFRICPVCETQNEMERDECIECGYVLKDVRSVNHEDEPDDIDINGIPPEWYNVTSMTLSRHEKIDKTPSLKIEFLCFMQSFSIWVCVKHQGFAFKKAIEVLEALVPDLVNVIQNFEECNWHKGMDQVDFCLEYQKEFKQPTRILVDLSEKFPRIIDYDYKTIERRGYPDSTSELDKQREKELEAAFL